MIDCRVVYCIVHSKSGTINMAWLNPGSQNYSLDTATEISGQDHVHVQILEFY